MEIGEYIIQFPTEIQEIVEELRNIILSNFSFLNEDIKFCIPVYMTEKKICSINSFEDHVNLMIWIRGEIKDSHSLLQGRNEMIKFIRVESLSDIKSELIVDLLAQAIKL
ncbi:MAG: DUF1801 domain-containing protein [Asgard group archaeon]|nr:DUF1801 domain-containing protein [Asgard group archaeon]